MPTTAMQRKRAAGKRAPKRKTPPMDLSDDLDWEPGDMIDQDSDDYWEQVKRAWDAQRFAFWGVYAALIVLGLYLIVGAFA